MSSTYEIWLSDPTVSSRVLIDQWEYLEYARRVNQEGSFLLRLPMNFDLSLLKFDSRIEIWRAPTNGELRLETETCWFIDQIRREIGIDGEQQIAISGPSAVNVLKRRIAAYAAGHAKASVGTAGANKTMHVIIDENFGTGADDVNRRISPEWFYRQITTDAGPTISKSYSRKNILDTLQEISSTSAALGFPTYFDVIQRTQKVLEFRTYVGQRGIDHSALSGSPVVFSTEYGNLEQPVLIDDYSNEASFVYAAGQGQEEDRLVATAEDRNRSLRSPYGRREVLSDARQYSTSAGLQDEANATLHERRALRRLSGTLLDTERTRYGTHWGFGDRVVMSAFDEQRNVDILGIHVTIVQDGDETVKAVLEDNDD